MNTKEDIQMHFFQKKELRKENSRWIMLYYKVGIIDSSALQEILHLSQNAYHATQWRKNIWDEIKTMGTYSWPVVALATSLAIIYMLASQLCLFDVKTNSKSKWVKKFIVGLCCPSSLFCEDFDLWCFVPI